jgi:hypothetical protein
MSKTWPQARQSLYAVGHDAIIMKSSPAQSRPASSTRLLFSISDREWIGWYLFSQDSNAFISAFNEDERANRKGRRIHFARGTRPMGFNPRVPRAVDQFANTKEDDWRVVAQNESSRATKTVANVRTIQAAGFLAMNLTLHFDPAERFQVLLDNWDRSAMPAESIAGNVFLLEVEKYSSAKLAATGRFRKIMLWHL